VTGSNGAGVWNETGRAITLIVTPPWWATWWFRSLALALVIGAVAAGYLWRVNNLQAQRRWLEALVAERTSELAEKTNALTLSNAQLELAKNQAEAARNQAEEANRAKSSFLAMMSHELRTPLNAILGFAQLLMRSRELPPEQRHSAATIQRSGEHLLTLINNVLDLSKIEAERMTLNEASVELDQLLDQLETMFQRRAAENGQILASIQEARGDQAPATS
jgi:signal transduction histidine kinase